MEAGFEADALLVDKDAPRVAMQLVLDTSESMGFLRKLDTLRIAATAVVQGLGEQDALGVVARKPRQNSSKADHPLCC